jgi:hypothetical protein
MSCSLVTSETKEVACITRVIEIGHPEDDGTGYPISLRDFDPEKRVLGKISASDKIRTPLLSATDDGRDAIEWIGGILRDQNRDQDALASIGRYLSDVFKGNQVGRQWFEQCAENDRQGNVVRMRTYIDIQPADLQHLPWELISYGVGRPIFKSRGHRVMRGRPDIASGLEGEAFPLPVRVLVVICDESKELLAEDEVDAIYAGISKQAGIWQVEVLREPDWQTLRDALTNYPPQILHIIAHTCQSDPPAFLVRERNPEIGHLPTYWMLRIADIDELLIEVGSMPRLLVLNACHTAEMIPVERFRVLGMNAVVATQSEIDSEEARCFTEAFYEKLVGTDSIEDAVFHARVAMRHRRQKDHHDWGIPVLTVFGSSANVIRSDLAQLREKARKLRSDRYTQTHLLVDRIFTHRKIWGPDNQHDHLRPEKHLVLVSGRKLTGKTELISSCMLTWQLRGSHAVIIDMADVPEDIMPSGDCRIVNAQQALIHICNSLSAGLKCVDFDASICDRLRDQAYKLRTCDASAYAQRCTAILDILEMIPDGPPPLLIAIDHLERIVDGDLHHVISDKLLWPIARNRLDNVYIIAAVTEDKLRENILGDLANRWRWAVQVERVNIDFFKPEQAISLGREFGARKGWVARSPWQSYVHSNPAMKNDWPPLELHKLAETYEQYERSMRRQ